MLRMNGMTRKDVKIVEFPYPDDWYNNPAMLDPMENPSELWLKRNRKRDLALRPAETALLEGKVDAIVVTRWGYRCTAVCRTWISLVTTCGAGC